MNALTPAAVQPDQSYITASGLDVNRVREDFPILKQLVRKKPLVYLDNAASTQKPKVVIDAVSEVYENYYSNIHRGVHTLSQKATLAYDQAREKVAQLINATDSKECIFVRNASEAINLVAYSYGDKFVSEGDEIIVSAMEHHSNIVPWQLLCQRKNAKLRVIPMNDAGELLMDEFKKMLNPKTRMVAVVHLSNALGTLNPVEEIIELAHQNGTPVLLDGAQSVPHMKMDVQALDCDFLAFSGHKMYGPTGIGVLYGKEKWLEEIPPFLGGGDMIESVSFEKTTYAQLPAKFEAGTPNIADGIALGTTCDYLSSVGLDTIYQYEQSLLEYGTELLSEVPGLTLIGTARKKAGVLSFVMDGIHPHDIGTMLDMEGIAIRSGHHCAEPVMKRLNVPATARASLAFYNTREELDKLADGLRKVLRVFGH